MIRRRIMTGTANVKKMKKKTMMMTCAAKSKLKAAEARAAERELRNYDPFGGP